MLILLTTNGRSNQFTLAIDGATADVNLHTDTSISCVSLSMSIVNVSAEGMQRSTTLFIVLATCDFSTTDTATDRHLNTFGTRAHRTDDSVLNSATILNTTFNLFGNILSNQNSIKLGALYLRDVNLDIFASKFLQFFFQFVNLRTCLTYNQTRTGGVDSNSEELQSSLDVNFRDAGLSETGIEIFTDFVVLYEFLLESATTVPVRIPSTDNA